MKSNEINEVFSSEIIVYMQFDSGQKIPRHKKLPLFVQELKERHYALLFLAAVFSSKYKILTLEYASFFLAS
jgi:hypothetical protein